MWSLKELQDKVQEFHKLEAPQADGTSEARAGLLHSQSIEDPSNSRALSAEPGKEKAGESGRKVSMKEDSDDEEGYQHPEKSAKQGGVSNFSEAQLSDDFIQRSAVEEKEVEANIGMYQSESEKQRKELLAKAISDKRATIVNQDFKPTGLRCDYEMHQNA